MNKTQKTVSALTLTAASVPAFAANEIATMAGAVNFDDAILGIVAIGGSLAAVYVITKGISLLTSMIKR